MPEMALPRVSWSAKPRIAAAIAELVNSVEFWKIAIAAITPKATTSVSCTIAGARSDVWSRNHGLNSSGTIAFSSANAISSPSTFHACSVRNASGIDRSAGSLSRVPAVGDDEVQRDRGEQEQRAPEQPPPDDAVADDDHHPDRGDQEADSPEEVRRLMQQARLV